MGRWTTSDITFKRHEGNHFVFYLPQAKKPVKGSEEAKEARKPKVVDPGESLPEIDTSRQQVAAAMTPRMNIVQAIRIINKYKHELGHDFMIYIKPDGTIMVKANIE